MAWSGDLAWRDPAWSPDRRPLGVGLGRRAKIDVWPSPNTRTGQSVFLESASDSWTAQGHNRRPHPTKAIPEHPPNTRMGQRVFVNSRPIRGRHRATVGELPHYSPQSTQSTQEKAFLLLCGLSVLCGETRVNPPVSLRLTNSGMVPWTVTLVRYLWV